MVNFAEGLLQTAKQEAEASLENFVSTKITTLLGLINEGANFYKSLGVKTKSEAETIWQKSYHHAAVREQVDDLLELESEWDSFLDRVERDLKVSNGQLGGGETLDRLSPETPLTDARTGQSVTLGHYLDRGQNLLLVLIRHFG